MLEVIFVLLVITYVISVSYTVAFTRSEGKDERGKQILTNAYTLGYSIAVIGILLSFLTAKLSFISVGYKVALDFALMSIWVSGIFIAVYIFYKNKTA
ncbi:hypothetical protein [Brevibacillus laterosporus]|uniref:hypothetical protein n=1 Tax=Brevibacillus laterosporus TaxID=1465 RepID=UPI000E6C289E|nr:hypothetical protein [Brevibacillus laterosporus]AYB41258.1 hypothetical protein D5F52_25140 [Brevibacillus laterosporus]MBM7108869.1 hypothetical protein [Brevibacillus laterosporus]NKQ21763.1 hypothetical protein [Brevibacillus laterosporus]WNX30569.1 hypothetical protein RWW94_20595 [Brevibacillus laterosporus]